MAFYELEPWGTGPADHRAAVIAWSAMWGRVEPSPTIDQFLDIFDRTRTPRPDVPDELFFTQRERPRGGRP